MKNLHGFAHRNVSEALWKHFSLDFLHENNFFHPKQLKYIARGVGDLLYPLSPIYRGKEGGGSRPARPGELGCFHQKAPPFVEQPGRSKWA